MANSTPIKTDILNSVYAISTGELYIDRPVNLQPTADQAGADKYYLKPFGGLKQVVKTPYSGRDYGSVVFKDVLYKIIGSTLYRINKDFTVTRAADIPDIYEKATFAIGWEYLAICANNQVWYFNEETGLRKLESENLGKPKTICHIDGYFLMNDDDYIYSTSINDPFEIKALAYGSAEISTDNIVGLVKVRNEVAVVGQNSIELFDNVGGNTDFTFARIEGSYALKGAWGKHSFCEYDDGLCFIGGGQKDSVGVYFFSNGNVVKVSGNELDYLLEKELADGTSFEMETILKNGSEIILIHGKNATYAIDTEASRQFNQRIWFYLKTTDNPFGKAAYDAHSFIVYNNQIVCSKKDSSGTIGVLTTDNYEHWGNEIGMGFGNGLISNEGLNGTVAELEVVFGKLVTTNKNTGFFATKYSHDGNQWSNERLTQINNKLDKRIVYLQLGQIKQKRIQRFRFTSATPMCIYTVYAVITGHWRP